MHCAKLVDFTAEEERPLQPSMGMRLDTSTIFAGAQVKLRRTLYADDPDCIITKGDEGVVKKIKETTGSALICWDSSGEKIVADDDFCYLELVPIHAWEVELETGWQRCDDDITRKLNAAEAGRKQHIEYEARGQIYKIDLQDMAQINILTGVRRCMRRQSVGISAASVTSSPSHWSSAAAHIARLARAPLGAVGVAGIGRRCLRQPFQDIDHRSIIWRQRPLSRD